MEFMVWWVPAILLRESGSPARRKSIPDDSRKHKAFRALPQAGQEAVDVAQGVSQGGPWPASECMQAQLFTVDF
jgi:hypothetical protein